MKKLDAWEFVVDGWSWWDGSSSTPYGIDTVAQVNVDTAGGAIGPYLVHRTALHLDTDQGFTSTLSLLRRGLWRMDEQILGRRSVGGAAGSSDANKTLLEQAGFHQ